MTYLTAYRKGSRVYGSGQGKAFKLPAPYMPPLRPPGANDNAPLPANDNTRNPRLPYSARGLRWLKRNAYGEVAGVVIDTFKLIDSLYNHNGYADNYSGWTLHKVCPLTGPPTHILFQTNNANPVSSVFACVSGQVATSATGSMFAALSNTTRSFCTGEVSNYTLAGDPRYRVGSTYKRPNASSAPIRRYNWSLSIRPILDPNLVPMFAPSEYPFPIPYALVPYRKNDPLGSQRTQGEQRPRIYYRRPPTKDKEVKVRGLIAGLQALHYATTEGLDALDAVHKALPKSDRAKASMHGGKWWNPTPQEKVAAVLGGFDKIDWNKAVLNLIFNHYSDKLVGAAARTGKKNLNSMGVVGGAAIFAPR